MAAKISSLSSEGACPDVAGWSGPHKGQADPGMSYATASNDVTVQDMVEIILQRMLGRIKEPPK